MTEDSSVWVSMNRADSNRLILGLEHDKDEPARVKVRSGQTPSPEDLPLTIYGSYSDLTIKDLPPFFSGGGANEVFSKEIADILLKFDLGDTVILPVRILQFDKKTEVQPERGYHLIQRYSVLSALDPESSSNLKTNKYSPGLNWRQKEEIKDDDIAVDRRALDAAVKIWSDPKLLDGDFYRGDIVEALTEANVSQNWNFKRCRLVD